MGSTSSGPNTENIGNLPYQEKVRMAQALIWDAHLLLDGKCDDETVAEFIEAVTQGLT